MTKYYRVLKDTFLWEVGAILECKDGEKGYDPIEDIWNKSPNETEYISCHIIEKNPEYFERVYKSEGEKMIFKTATQLKEIYKKFIPDK